MIDRDPATATDCELNIIISAMDQPTGFEKSMEFVEERAMTFSN